MKKIKMTLKMVMATGALLASLFFTSCTSAIDADVSGSGSSTRVTNISSSCRRSALTGMVYMGGSVLYSEENAAANQLARNVTVATRIGKVNVKNTGNGKTVSVHTKEADYGYIVINSVNMESVSFDYYQFAENAAVQEAYFVGSYDVAAGNACDLNRDGVNDVEYCKPDAGTQGRKHRMWLKFLSNGEHSAMYSVIADQYEGGNYPGGLFGINTEGRSVVTKYNYSDSSRAAVASITNGDYVLDTVDNKIAVYHGSTINSRSARTINDDELSTAEFEGTTTAEDLEFKDYEFVSGFDIYKLLEALPSSAVTEAYNDKTISEAVSYLNKLMRQRDFLEKVLSASTDENAMKMKESLSGYVISSDMESVYITRGALCQLYPDLCPEMTSLTSGLGTAFPELYINIGHTDEYEAAPEESRATIANIISHDETDKLYPTKDVDKYDQTYLDYAAKRDEIYDYFSSFYYVDISSGLMNDVVGEQFLGIEDKALKGLYKDFVKNLGLELKVGATGSISVSNGNPKAEVKLAALASFEIKNSIAFTLEKGSFFEKDPKLTKAPTALERYKALYPDESSSSSVKTEEDAKKFFNVDHGYKEKDLGVFGTTGWVDTKDIETGDMPSLSKDAKFKHVQFSPVKSFPLVITFDIDFDLLRSLKISAECDNLYIGGVVIAGVEGHAGINWGFSKKFWGAPLPWSFYCNFDKGGNTIWEHAYFGGFPRKDIDGTAVGVALKGQITPILKLRGGVGVGGDVWVAKTDITIGGSITAAAPLTVLTGINYSVAKGINVVLQADAKLMFNWGLDVQFYLDPPLVSEIKKTLPIYNSDVLAKFQLFKIKSENFGTPKCEGFKKLDC